MRHTRWALVLVGILSLAALGDVVYMKDGRTHEGKVTREGDKVKVELAYHRRIGHCAERVGCQLRDHQPAATQHVTVTPRGHRSRGPTERVFTSERATLAEGVALMYARNLAAMPEGEMKSTSAASSRVGRRRPRIQAPDCSGVWITPADFLDRRKTDLELMKAAGDLVRKGRKPSFQVNPPANETAKQRRIG